MVTDKKEALLASAGTRWGAGRPAAVQPTPEPQEDTVGRTGKGAAGRHIARYQQPAGPSLPVAVLVPSWSRLKVPQRVSAVCDPCGVAVTVNVVAVHSVVSS